MKISDQERAILREIQRDASLSLAELAERVASASSTIWRKLNEMEAAGIIRRRVALLDPAKVGARLVVFASVSLKDHTEDAVSAFARLIADHPEILECHAVSGGSDYILKIRVADVEAYEHFMSGTLLRSSLIRSVYSSFGLKELKSTTELPL
jgi:Lrp/AsnC family transcriptional regulator